MKTLRVVVAVLLCLALPLQAYAALRLAATPCPAMHQGAPVGSEGHAPGQHDGCQPMPCCQDQHKGPLAGTGCDNCANCMPGPAFLSLDASPDAPRRPEDLGAQRRTPGSHLLALFAIWRPPATC